MTSDDLWLTCVDVFPMIHPKQNMSLSESVNEVLNIELELEVLEVEEVLVVEAVLYPEVLPDEEQLDAFEIDLDKSFLLDNRRRLARMLDPPDRRSCNLRS